MTSPFPPSLERVDWAAVMRALDRAHWKTVQKELDREEEDYPESEEVAATP